MAVKVFLVSVLLMPAQNRWSKKVTVHANGKRRIRSIAGPQFMTVKSSNIENTRPPSHCMLHDSDNR